MADNTEGKFESKPEVQTPSTKANLEANVEVSASIKQLATTARDTHIDDFKKQVGDMSDEDKKDRLQKNLLAINYINQTKSALDSKTKDTYKQAGLGDTPETFDYMKHTT